MRQQVTAGPDQTIEVGRQLARSLRGGDIVMLYGPIGAGKSVLARGIAEGLGAARWRGSPTFTLINEYSTHPALYHLDLYRLGAADVEDLGLEDYARGDAVMVVEWADRAPEALRRLARRTVEIEIDHAGEHERAIQVHEIGVPADHASC